MKNVKSFNEFLNESVKITPEEKEIFDYLNTLRDSGETNMFGAGKYVESLFGLDRRSAREVTKKWMGNFNPDGYEDLLEGNS